MSLLACEDGGICAEGGMKSEASGAIGSEEGCEEACEDDCESVRGLFGLPPLFFRAVVAGRLFGPGRPLLPAD